MDEVKPEGAGLAMEGPVTYRDTIVSHLPVGAVIQWFGEVKTVEQNNECRPGKHQLHFSDGTATALWPATMLVKVQEPPNAGGSAPEELS